MKFPHVSLVSVAVSQALVSLASAQAEPFYTSSVFGPADPPNANEWGGGNRTNSSVIFEVFIDYTQTVAEATFPFTLFENGADAVGSGVAIDGDEILFAAGGGSVANTAVARGPHGLVAGQTGVQIVAVLEFGGGTDGNQLLSLYVNGALVGTADAPTGNDWAGINTSNLGTPDSFTIFEYVPSINPNAGDGANGRYTEDYPDANTSISFAAYELGVGDNTVANILVVPGPDSLDLDFAPSATVPASFDFTWSSQEGALYDLVSSTDLSIDPATWEVWEGNEDVPGGVGTTTLTAVPAGNDSRRFFAVIRK